MHPRAPLSGLFTLSFRYQFKIFFEIKRPKKEKKEKRLVRCAITKPRVVHVRGIVVGKNDNIYAGWKEEEEEEQSNTTVVEVAFSRVYYE